jgi:hypothetical protein
VTDRPIIFSGPMVRALLDGSKTMTRRLAWHLPGKRGRMMKPEERWPLGMWPSPWQAVKARELLWVREAFHEADVPGGVEYRADRGLEVRSGGWRTSIFMSRRFSRLTLAITATKIERLTEISDEDARSEGVMIVSGGLRPAESFSQLWDHLHGEGAWQSNPEVVAIRFTVVLGNIDKVKAT